MEEQLYNVGQIINTHGIKGEVKVHRITDFDERFQPGQLLYWVHDQKEPKQLIVKSHRLHKGFDLLTFEGHPSINDVEEYREGFLKVPESEHQLLDEHEFYFHEIIGSKVFLDSGEEIGVIKEILTPGANDVWVVKRQSSKDVLIPYIEDVVKEVDVEKQQVIIDPIEGLLD
ncbi:ribosome maturation factor RimM [Halobacillus shinanisalinarum]|uniref:Ribosome maturation factor RimM n=1 Tax=Halobacillus shinanisalinarum TaxID=2932258 RepID=A0ABY4GZW7_9BACI|nr:ribosome maturation factor RimM [Halobacillus shinanisalinarum]UOQ93200.1 ribosome maturation factor RimM [Halobacillus shinanisalinarum]